MSNDAVWVLSLVGVIFQCAVLSAAESHSQILLPIQLGRDDDSLPILSSWASCPAPNPNPYYRPVIGILSHPGDGASGRLSNATGASYIAASYVKFVEAAGARAIPLVYNEPPEKLLKKLDLVNGVLFTGGWPKEVYILKLLGEYSRKFWRKMMLETISHYMPFA